MATEFKNKMSELMKQAWMLVKVYGFSMAEAMKQAWQVLKLKAGTKERCRKVLLSKAKRRNPYRMGNLERGLDTRNKRR